MGKPRKYGASPYAVAVVHGGPGAAGEMKPVALATEEIRSWSLMPPDDRSSRTCSARNTV